MVARGKAVVDEGQERAPLCARSEEYRGTPREGGSLNYFSASILMDPGGAREEQGVALIRRLAAVSQPTEELVCGVRGELYRAVVRSS